MIFKNYLTPPLQGKLHSDHAVQEPQFPLTTGKAWYVGLNRELIHLL